MYPWGNDLLLNTIAVLPSIVGQLITMWICSKATVVLSNVPGIKTGWQFGKC
jgi:hypothetical protein